MDISCSTWLSASGLVLDILGFILISIAIVKPKKPLIGETETLNDAFGNPIAKDLITLEYLKNDCKSRLGFYLILLGFLMQLIGTIIKV